QRSNSFAPVEIIDLRGIDQIESCYPANYACRKHERRNIKRSRLRDPCADWSNRKCQPEKKMCRASEPFRNGIEKNQRQRYGREDAGQPVNCASGQQKSCTTENQQNHSRQFWNEQVPRGRARIALIK